MVINLAFSSTNELKIPNANIFRCNFAQNYALTIRRAYLVNLLEFPSKFQQNHDEIMHHRGTTANGYNVNINIC